MQLWFLPLLLCAPRLLLRLHCQPVLLRRRLHCLLPLLLRVPIALLRVLLRVLQMPARTPQEVLRLRLLLMQMPPEVLFVPLLLMCVPPRVVHCVLLRIMLLLQTSKMVPSSSAQKVRLLRILLVPLRPPLHGLLLRPLLLLNAWQRIKKGPREG